MKVFKHVEELLDYGLKHNLIELSDVPFVRNELWQLLGIETELDALLGRYAFSGDIYDLLDSIVKDARALGRSLEFIYEVESFYAEIMSKLLPRPSETNRMFSDYFKESPRAATDFFYDLSIASTYIRTDRTSKNISWVTASQYGDMDITINLSKPEKDPKEIALQKHMKASKYPKCLLCAENVGYKGHVSHPARQNHRIVRLELDGEPWYFQYSPYVYYNEHAIVLCEEHRNMKIDRSTFVRLCDFTDQFPHYFIGSNADLHTVGGSILSHDHYQAGNYEMPMMRAKVLSSYKSNQFKNITISVLDWPLSVLRVSSNNRDELIEACDQILMTWIGYSDHEVELIAHTTERHNTVTPILKKDGERYDMYLALRNNRKTEAHPDGLFHPHSEHHHIKKENIGLIEVMGLAVLPSRLVEEMEAIEQCYDKASGLDLEKCQADDRLAKHMDWLKEIKISLDEQMDSGSELNSVIRDAIGAKFVKVLTNSGIYKDKWSRIGLFLEEACLCKEA